MSGIRLNQVTLAAKDMAASVLFYQNLGLILIVDSAPRYVRFEFPSGPDAGEPATLSLHQPEENWRAHPDQPLIYFEVDNLDEFLSGIDIEPVSPPETQSYLWRQADIIDPGGNRLRLYQAGENRRFPPWRIDTPPLG